VREELGQSLRVRSQGDQALKRESANSKGKVSLDAPLRGEEPNKRAGETLKGGVGVHRELYEGGGTRGGIFNATRGRGGGDEFGLRGQDQPSRQITFHADFSTRTPIQGEVSGDVSIKLARTLSISRGLRQLKPFDVG